MINHKANNKLANYYKSDKISNSLKSMIHIIYRIQLPNKVWDLIKEFSIMSKEQIHLCRQVYCLFSSHSKPLIRNGSIVDCLYFTSMFNMCLLERLHLDDNKISDVSALGKALATNTTLKELDLQSNKINDVSALGKALETNTTLERLHLDRNQISDVSALGKALETNTTLEWLHLDRNQISDVSALGKALATNTTLKELSLWGNQISDEDKEYLKKCSVICNLSF